MPKPEPFQYAMWRVVPRVERGEAVNAGVVLFCRPKRFLGARTELDEALLAALLARAATRRRCAPSSRRWSPSPRAAPRAATSRRCRSPSASTG